MRGTVGWLLVASFGQSGAQIQALDPEQAQQERIRRQMAGQPAAYEDKVMSPDEASVQMSSDDVPEVDGESSLGLRTYGMESRYGFSSFDASGAVRQRANEWGQRIYFSQQTVNYGEWNLQMEGRLRRGTELLSPGTQGYAYAYGMKLRSERITLRNYGLPLTANVFADSTVGDQMGDVTDALKRNYRLFLGNSVVRGATTRVYGAGFDVIAGMGQRGRLVGAPFPGFESSGGSLAWVGASRRFDSGISGGLQFNQAREVPQNRYQWTSSSPESVGQTGPREDVASMAISLGYGVDPVKDGDYRLRWVALNSQTSADIVGRNHRARGLFLEGSGRFSGLRHELGLYQADPNLRFGDNQIASDHRGAYWRVDGNKARLSWGLGADAVQYNPGRNLGRPHSRQWSLYGNVQYRIHRNDLIGGSGHWTSQNRYAAQQGRPLESGQRSLQSNAFYQTRFFDWAPTRLRVNVWRNQSLVANDRAATGEEIQWEQDWIAGKFETMRPELTTTLGYARDRSNAHPQTYPTAGVIGRYWLSADWNVSGNLQYTSRSSDLFTSRGLSGSVMSETTLSAGWHMGVAVQLNQARMQTQGTAGMSTLLASRSSDKSAFVYLRWDGSSGRPQPAMGQNTGSSAGGGMVRGLVFQDANNDGEQQVGEGGVANVEVILDGRYRTLTDAVGQFEFAMVATGGHQLSLRAESVPLPWGPPADRSVSVEVPLRGVASARLPVIRVGGSD